MIAPRRSVASRLRFAATCTFGIVLALAAAPAEADEEGDAGRLVALRLNTAASDDHASFHGSITIKRTNGKRDEYLWGGSTCPGQKMAEPQVALLSHALSDRHKTMVFPLYAKGEGDRRCLVAFELRAG